MQTTEIDLVKVVVNGIVEVREATATLNDEGTEVSKTYKRWCLTPGQDVSDQTQAVQDVCAATWTPEVVAAYQQLVANKED
jgi:hypothetical protein